jgi:exosome complex RNA-binding protein Rrp42 (RNase PH superfamily)
MSEQQHQDDSLFQRLFPVEHYDVYISNGLRPDGRKLAECRPAVCSTRVIPTAASSSRVELGGTLALGGVTLELSTPSDDLPDAGTVAAQVCAFY